MIDDEIARLPASALRDYHGDPRLERVWRKLDAGADPAPAVSPRLALFFAPVAGFLLFAVGVWVGRSWDVGEPSTPLAVAEPTAAREPARPTPAPAAGRTEDTRRATPAAQSRRPLRRPAPAAEELPPDTSKLVVVAPEPGAPVQPVEPGWQHLVDVGDFEGARTALDQAGGFDAAVASASAEQLMSLVDVARASGGREQAVRALRRLLDAFPGAPEAPVAAWTLGNLLDQSGDHAGAVRAYQLYRRLSPEGDFAEDAAARQVGAALSQGNVELAEQLVEQYAKDFPNGRQIDELREELDKLVANRADAGLPGDEAAPREAEPAPK